MFIESVRARATCNTIISSHPVPSHRPCTNSFLLSVHASRSFPLLISFFFLSPILPSLFTFTFLFTSSSSPPLIQIRFFTENLVSSFVSISFLLFLLLFHFFHSSPSSLSSFHPPSSSYFHVDATPIEPPISYPRSSSRRPFNPISSGGG